MTSQCRNSLYSTKTTQHVSLSSKENILLLHPIACFQCNSFLHPNINYPVDGLSFFLFSKAKNFNPRQQLDRRSEMRKLNEALQYLTKKRTKSKAQHDWNFKGKKGIVITSVMNALAPDERRKYMRSEAYRQEMALVLKAKEIESKKAMELAESLTEYMDPVKPNRSVMIIFSSIKFIAWEITTNLQMSFFWKHKYS